MTFKAIILLRRRDDMTREQFRSWWMDDHAQLAARLPGVRRIVFNLCEPDDSVVDDRAEVDAVDGVSELWFDSETDFLAAYATDVGRSVAADSMAHLQSRTRLFVTEREIVG